MRICSVRFLPGLLLLVAIGASHSAGDVVAHWRFQHAVDGDWAHPSHLIKDSSGKDRHGHAVGKPRYHAVAPGSSDIALAFSGADDRILIPDHSLFHLTKSLTLEASIKIERYPTSSAKLGHIVFRGDDRAGFDPWHLAITASGQVEFLIADALNNGSVLHSPEPLPIGEFLHIAATLDDTSGQQALFVNGVKVASVKTNLRAFGPLGGDNPGIGIANRQTPSDAGFRGSITEVRISSEALAPDQFLPSVSPDSASGSREIDREG